MCSTRAKEVKSGVDESKRNKVAWTIHYVSRGEPPHVTPLRTGRARAKSLPVNNTKLNHGNQRGPSFDDPYLVAAPDTGSVMDPCLLLHDT